MAIIKRTLKYGTAVGITYLTIEQRLWSQLSEKQINDKLSVVSKCGQQMSSLVTQKTGFDVNKWTNCATCESFDLNSVWNRSVKTVFTSLSTIHVKDLYSKVAKYIDSK
ncbi:uncharacterized protein LOC128965565 [Oppia nitens]|uniref:uncharacterized protein LOC128965565 n=1 Tax=Oppia nitens TaxID=1686743 RepID=UPI0023DA5EEF|nr:uncharacterized protein LOC128965565 [Oppia nitens]